MPSTDLRAHARHVADVAIRDGERWRDRRLPECGRVINELADRLDAAEKALREIAEWELSLHGYVAGMRHAQRVARAYFASVEGGQDGQ